MSYDSPLRPNRRELVVVILLVLFGLAIALPYVQQARMSARQTQARNNLKQIGLALANYHDTHQVFPPGGVFDDAGVAYHGWETFLTPYLDSSPFYSQIDFSRPWDDRLQVESFLKVRYPVYQRPSVETTTTPDGFGQMHVAANDWIFHRNSSTRQGDLPNLAQTLLIADLPTAFPPFGLPEVWRNVRAGWGKSPEGFGGDSNGGHVLLADGHIRKISPKIDPNALIALQGPPHLQPKPENVARARNDYRRKPTPYWQTVFIPIGTDAQGIEVGLTGRHLTGEAVRSLAITFKGKREPTIESLQMLASTATAFQGLQEFPEVQELRLDNACNDTTLANLPTMPHLKKLILNGQFVTPKGLKHLQRFPVLEVVEIDGKQIAKSELRKAISHRD